MFALWLVRQNKMGYFALESDLEDCYVKKADQSVLIKDFADHEVSEWMAAGNCESAPFVLCFYLALKAQFCSYQSCRVLCRKFGVNVYCKSCLKMGSLGIKIRQC